MLKILKHIALLLLLMGSCTYNYIEPELIPDLVSYEQHVQAVFDNNCTACHNGHYAVPDLSAAVSYEALISGGFIDTVTAEDSKLILKMSDNHYGGTLTSSEIDMVTKWIEQGALNN